jgi:predicted ATPase/class 3 adenylate cyclase
MNPFEEIQKLMQGIAALEAQRTILGESVVETALAPLRKRLATLRAYTQTEQQRKLVTVLFADISGFTTLSENLDAEDLSELMNAIWQKLDATILNFGGHIDKHLGDGVMAFWGAETAREDDPELAVRAALEMQQILQAQAYGYPAVMASSALKMRIGINTGPVLLGALGTQGEYTAMGDAVNVAARLEQAAPVGGILISHDTHRHVSGVFEVLEREPFTVKGKSEPIQTYLVERVRPRVFHSGSRGVEGIETEMVGRISELRRLHKAVENALAGHQLQFLLVTGEVGVGKSRLLHEFQKSCRLLQDQTRLFRARTEQQRKFVPFSLIRDLFSDRFGVQESDNQADARLKLEQGIVDLIGPEGLEEAHFIGQLLGLEYADSPYLAALGDDPRQIYDRSCEAVMRFFKALVRHCPVTFLIEDLHWADSNSIELLIRFLHEFEQEPVVIVATARPTLFEYHPDFSKESVHFPRIDLQPLSIENSYRLVQDILHKVPHLPDDLLKTIASHADGNPFFIEELIKMLIENGAILKGEPAWTVDSERLRGLKVPPTLIGVLQARLDRLTTSEKVVLHRASVVGRVFWDEAVTHLGELETAVNPAEVPTALRNLRTKELVFGRAKSTFSDTREYLFKNSILRDVTYEQVLKAQRRLYHHQAADWLIEKSGDRANEYAALIAEHFDRAGENDLAADWYSRAAQAAEENFAQETVIDYYQRALALMGPQAVPARLIQPYYGLGMMYYRLTRSADSLQAFHSMLVHAEKAGEVRAQLRALHGYALVYEFQGDYAEVVQAAERAEKVLRAAKLTDRLELAQIRLEKARAYYYEGRYPDALQAGTEGLEVALTAETDVRIQIARLYNVLGMIYTAEGNFDKALEYKMQSLERWRAIGNKLYTAAVLNNVGETYRMMGAYQQAIEYYQQSMETAQQLHDVGQVVVCLNNLGGAYVGLGKFEPAVQALEQIFVLSKEKTFTDAESLSFLAEAYLGLGNFEKALSAAQDAVSLCQAGVETSFGGNAWRVLGRVAARLGQPVSVDEQTYDAAACFARSLETNRKTGVPRDQALTLWDWARHARQQGDLVQATVMWREARAIFERLNLIHFSALMDREWLTGPLGHPVVK